MKVRKELAATVLAVGVLLAAACGLRIIQGSGNVITEARDVSGFDQVILMGHGDMIITQGTEESMTIETDDNLMEHIRTEVRDGKLYVEFPRNTTLDPSDKIIFRINVTELTGIEASGAGLFEIASLTTPGLDITFNGAARIAVQSLTADDVSVEINGTGDVELAGEVDSQRIVISGLGKYAAPNLKSDDASIRIAGAGDVVVRAASSLSVEIEGGGRVGYYGSPNVIQDVQGGGRIEKLGD